MAYTYDDVVTAANSAGLLSKFSNTDIETAKKNPEFGLSLLGFMKDEQNATTAEGRILAREGANQLRSSVGNYTVGADGVAMSDSQALVNQMKNYGDFTYGNEDRLQELVQQTSKPTEFSYDYEQDPAWQAYRKAAVREGDRVVADTLARASAGTGGVPSSYAIAAAAQAGHQYAAGLTDMIPTLRENAYNEYLNNYNMQLKALGVLQDDKAMTFDEWQQRYNMMQNNLAILQGVESTELARQQQEKSDALTLYQTLGYATPEIAATLGIPEGTRIAGTGGNPGGDNPYINYTRLGYGNLVEVENFLSEVAEKGNDDLWGQLNAWYLDGHISETARDQLYAKFYKKTLWEALNQLRGNVKTSWEALTQAGGNTLKTIINGLKPENSEK